MKQEIAEKWVAALRSGKYQQGFGSLRNSNNQFCCLGVLCEISGQGEWENNIYMNNSVWLPEMVKTWAALKFRESTEDILSSYNDNNKSFEFIADYIEKHWEEL